MGKSNLWILTEERPKKEVIKEILLRFATDRQFVCFIDILRILPVLENGKFSFLYEVVGFRCNQVENVYMKSISGSSSFVDFLVFYQHKQPEQNDMPLYAIEETKTDDSESRNTGIYQRASKFVYVDEYYPNSKKIMLYNFQISPTKQPTDTNIFGTRLLLTLGVEFVGKDLGASVFRPFSSIDEIIAFKNNMSRAPTGNVPILISKSNTIIRISGRLVKSDSLAHDPNIGFLSLISATIRKLGWCGEIVITSHGLEQKHVTSGNKFVRIANELNIRLNGLSMPTAKNKGSYWRYELKGEKLGTIFVHVVVENFTEGYSIFENHAGCEKGYFITREGKPLQLEKYSDRTRYKEGDKSQIISIPDLILIDFGRSEIINVEGKQYRFRQDGIEELANFDEIESRYIKRYYREFDIIRTVVLYGSKEKEIIEIEVGFLLNENGDLILGIRAPELFKEAIRNLLDFWS